MVVLLSLVGAGGRPVVAGGRPVGAGGRRWALGGRGWALGGHRVIVECLTGRYRNLHHDLCMVIWNGFPGAWNGAGMQRN